MYINNFTGYLPQAYSIRFKYGKLQLHGSIEGLCSHIQQAAILKFAGIFLACPGICTVCNGGLRLFLYFFQYKFSYTSFEFKI